jgi:hypothetical protein
VTGSAAGRFTDRHTAPVNLTKRRTKMADKPSSVGYGLTGVCVRGGGGCGAGVCVCECVCEWEGGECMCVCVCE